jgi:hypothetical protein
MTPVRAILKHLERNTATGTRLSQVFDDWLDLTHATLSALPDHARNAAEAGRLAEDTPETQALFARLRTKYPHDWAWQNFHEAFTILLQCTENFWTPATIAHKEAYGWDALGALYMETAAKEHAGQFFTPWCIAETMARITIQNGAEEINNRLRQAQRRASRRNDINAHLLTATLLAGLCVPKEETTTYFLSRVVPLVTADFEPITILDPCVGSGVTLLAAARLFPAWAVQSGLVQFFGMDIDATCVKMAQVNMMLIGVNGYGLHSALTAAPRQLASLPEPFQQAYALAQEAQAAGDTHLVTEIADTLRVSPSGHIRWPEGMQMLFDPELFAVRLRTPKAAPRPPKTRTERAAAPALLDLAASLMEG